MIKKWFITILLIASVTTASAALYKGVTQSWQYDKQKVFYSGTTTDWLKDLVEWSIAYSWPTVSWKILKDGSSTYTTPTTTLIQEDDYIKYRTPTTTYERKWDEIIYTTPTTTLIIGKDKIRYTTPTTTREIDGWDWKYSTPTSNFSN
jgi:hypothetical protein